MLDNFDRYKDRVEKELGKKLTPVPISPDSAIKCVNRFKKRSGNTVSPNSTDTGHLQEESFDFALNNSMSSERVLFLDSDEPEKEWLSILVPNEKAGRNISSPLLSKLTVGQTVEWVRHDTKWVCVSMDPGPKGFLRGNILEAKWRFRWSDDKGNVYYRWAVVKGPVETKYKQENLGEFLAGKPNDTLEITIGALNKDVETLKKYQRISIGGRVWKIAVIDDITEPNIVSIHCIENYENKDEDEIIGDIPVIEDVYAYNLITNFDFSTKFALGEYPIETAFYNGDNLIEDVTVDVKFLPVGKARLVGNKIELLETGELSMRFTVKDYPYNKTLDILVEETIDVDQDFVEIVGDLDVYHGEEVKYVAKKYVNGQPYPVKGEWITEGAKHKIELKTDNEIVIEAVDSKGDITIMFMDFDTMKTYAVKAKITSLFGKS